MGAISDLWNSERGLFAIVLVAAATTLAAIGKLPVDTWQTFCTMIFGVYVAGKTVTATASIIKGPPGATPVTPGPAQAKAPHAGFIKLPLAGLLMGLTIIAISLSPLALHGCKGASGPLAAAGSCEVAAVSQIVKEDGVPILVDIMGAVSGAQGGVSALISRLTGDFDAPTIACAAKLVVAIETGKMTLASAGAGSGSALKLSPPPPGLAGLNAEISKRGW